MGVGGAAGRLTVLAEGQGGKQAVAARALLLRNFDGGSEGVFARRRIDGIALKQHIATQPMKK